MTYMYPCFVLDKIEFSLLSDISQIYNTEYIRVQLNHCLYMNYNLWT